MNVLYSVDIKVNVTFNYNQQTIIPENYTLAGLRGRRPVSYTHLTLPTTPYV